jgi:hypothetical protein
MLILIIQSTGSGPAMAPFSVAGGLSIRRPLGPYFCCCWKTNPGSCLGYQGGAAGPRLFCFQVVANNLPPSTIIPSPAKIPDLISISCIGLCGEQDCRCRSWENARLLAGTAGVFQAKKYGYGLDIGSFWPGDNCRIIAVSFCLRLMPSRTAPPSRVSFIAGAARRPVELIISASIIPRTPNALMPGGARRMKSGHLFPAEPGY